MQNRIQEQPETLGQRLRTLRGRRSRDAFAAELGIHKNTLARYETDERGPDAAVLRSICQHCGVSSDWLLNGDQHGAPVATPDSDYHAPALFEPLDFSPVMLHRDWVDAERMDADELMVAIMVGDSMRPTFDDGDVLVIQRRGSTPLRDGVHLLELDGVRMVKRLHGLGSNAVQLSSDNTCFQPLYLTATDLVAGGRCQVLGRIVLQLRKV